MPAPNLPSLFVLALRLLWLQRLALSGVKAQLAPALSSVALFDNVGVGGGLGHTYQVCVCGGRGGGGLSVLNRGSHHQYVIIR